MTSKTSSIIPVAEPVIGDKEISYMLDAISSGWVSSIGPYINRFEEGFAEYIGVRHAIAVSNGTTALHLILHAMGIGSGDEVIIPDLTFAATAHAVLQVGATPVLVDVEPDTWCISVLAVERAITQQTKAVIPVHLFGHPANLSALLELCAKHNILVVEDAAEAHGAVIDGAKVGSFGHAAAFSFYGNKIITTGEGGMITTSNTKLAERIRYLKDHGMSSTRRYYHTELAFNYRMTNVQAALGLAQLEQIEQFIEKKRTIYSWYREYLTGVHDITLNVEKSEVRNVFWLTCLVTASNSRKTSVELAEYLRLRGIETRPFFVPMHELPHLAMYKQVGENGLICCVAAELSSNGLCLPSSCKLDENTVQLVCTHILQALSNS